MPRLTDNRILEILNAKGMTLRDLSKLLGVNETTVGRWVKGTMDFSVSRLFEIAAALQVDWRELFPAPKDGTGRARRRAVRP